MFGRSTRSIPSTGWRRQRAPSQGWKTFLRYQAEGITSIDLFVVRTISFKLLYGLVILRHARRRPVTVSVTTSPTAERIAGQVTEAFPWDEALGHLIRDRDGVFGPAYPRRIRAMRIRDHPTAPRSPWQNGHVERLNGSIRRECLDHVILFGEAHLPPSPEGLRFVLQRVPDPSIIGQGRGTSGVSTGPLHRGTTRPGRLAPSIRPSLSFEQAQPGLGRNRGQFP